MNTKALRQKILDLAIHGKLVPQDPNDEPASVLLERIRAEKERLVKEGKIKRPKKTKATSDKPHYENVPFEVPSSWVWTTLGDIAEIITGNTPSKDIKEYYSGNIPFFKPTDLEQGIHTKYSKDRLTPLGFEQSRKLPANSVLVTCIGATIGKTGLTTVEGTCNQQINAIIPTSAILAKFLFYVCISDYMQHEIKANASATTLPILNKANFSKIAITIPPLQEQSRIVKSIEHWLSLVDCIEGNKENLQRTIMEAKSKILTLAIHGKLVPQDSTDEPASELLKRINPKAEITCDNGHYQKLPEGWAILKVGDVAEYINGRAFKPEEWEQTGLPIIRIQNLNDPNAYYNRTKNEYEEKYLIKKGDLLFAWTASLGTYIWKGEDAWLNQHIFKVVPYPFMDKKYLYYAFHAMITEFYRKSHGSGMIHITRKQFEEITLWLPPLAEQYRIVQYLQQVFEKLDSIVENL